MQLRILRVFVISWMLIFISGCVTQSNVKLADSFWKNKQQKIIVAVTKAPEPGLYKTGSQGLLDIAINSAMTNEIDEALKHTDLTWYQQLPKEFAMQLKQQKLQAHYYPEPISPDEENYATYIARTNSDKMLLIKLDAVGAIRSYYSFIPTSEPKAYCVITGTLIDAENKVLWRYKAKVTQPVQGEWDEAPHYPNLMTALKSAINASRQELLDSFFSGR